MSVDVILLGIIQSIRLATEILERHQRGELTEDELAVEAGKMRLKLDDANARWKAAKAKRAKI